MRRPKSDLDDLAMPKEEAPAAPARASRTYSRSLTVRLTEEDYGRLRRYTVSAPAGSSGRVTHQSVIEMALREWLDRHGA